uniref:WAP2 n=2 Tax=Eriocheir sinensis TaxID=95602 RepID=K7P581_ERISI|nr:WAP2 [Eriocheir sinensis]
MFPRRFPQVALALLVLVAAVHAQGTRGGLGPPSSNPRAVCPDPNSFGRVCFQYFDQCASDRQCRRGERCCLVAGCGRECIARSSGGGPVSKPGTCPVIQFIVAPQCSPRDRIDRCQSDRQCPGTQKCCFLVCNRQCSEPL